MLQRKLFGSLAVGIILLVPVILQADPMYISLIFDGVSPSGTRSLAGAAGSTLTATPSSVTMLGNQTSNLSDLTAATLSGGGHAITAAPEPASLALFGIGLVGLGFMIRLKHLPNWLPGRGIARLLFARKLSRAGNRFNSSSLE